MAQQKANQAHFYFFCAGLPKETFEVASFEGTDEMLRRAGGFKTDEALFVKTVKARQDWRFDVPCFGLRTLKTMQEAHLSAAALESGKVIILEKPAVLKQARAWGIELLGFE